MIRWNERSKLLQALIKINMSKIKDELEDIKNENDKIILEEEDGLDVYLEEHDGLIEINKE